MLWLNLQELAVAASAIVAAVLLGRLLYRTARRNPDSILVHNGMLADMLCVAEVILVVMGPMLLVRVALNAL